MSFNSCSGSVDFTNVRLTSDFWRGRQMAMKDGALPAMYNQMKRTGRWDSLKLKWKPGDPNPPHRFWDSDVAKWVEAACYSLVLEPDSELSHQVEEAVDNIRGAQQEDGYLNTYYTVVEPGKRWTNISWSHEMYNAGHLLEAALAHNIYTQSTRLLNPILKYIKHIDSVFGLRESQKPGYPGHQEIELALLRAAEHSGDKKLLELANYFIEERGQPRPEGHYYVIEAHARGEEPKDGPAPKGAPMWSYHQADRPIRETKCVEGHSVRAMYWLTAVANLARLTKDESLLAVAQKLWDSTTKCKMYISGGLGAIGDWEGFGADYFFPNELGYLETCAAIALVFFAYQMLLINPRKAEYADVLELALHNAVLVGVSLDGKSFFYENPPATIGKRYQRSSWFDVSCCPSNVARLINTVGKYIYTLDTDDTVHVHLYISSEATIALSTGERVHITQVSNGPWYGGATFTVEGEGKHHVKFSFRKPLGSADFEVYAGGVRAAADEPVFATTVITLKFSYRARAVRPHPLDLENRHAVAFMRGPFVYCAETIDNDVCDLRLLRVPRGMTIREEVEYNRFSSWGLQPVVLKVPARAVEPGQGVKGRSTELTLIPMFLWANRGQSDLRTWLPEDI